MEKYIKHRLSQREKYKDDSKWGRDFIDIISPPYSNTINSPLDKEEMLQNYMLYNNQLDQSTLDRWCKPFGIDVGQFDESVLPFNKSYNKVNVLLGEELKRGTSYKPVLTSDRDIKKKTLELREKINQYVQAQISAEIAKQTMSMEGADEEQIQQMQEKITADYQLPDVNQTGFLSEKEILRGKILDYAKFNCELKKKKNLSFKHAILSDGEFVYVGIKNGKPTFEPVNPLTIFFQKSPENEYVHYGDYAGTRVFATKSEVLEKYGDYLTEDQIKKLETSFPNQYGGGINTTGEIYYENTIDYKEPRLLSSGQDVDLKQIGTYSTTSLNRTTYDLVEVVHAEWRTLRKVIFLTLVDEYGEETVDIVDEDFPIPTTAVKIPFINRYGNKTVKRQWVDEELGVEYTAEEVWIPRIWEGTRIDGRIFINVREKPYQPLSIENPFAKARLGYHGVVYTSTNAKSTSLFSRMKPYQMLYFVAMDQISKLLSRNLGRQITIDMAQLPRFNDKLGREDMELFLFYQAKGITFYNSMSNAEGGLIPPTRGRAVESQDMSVAQDIMQLTNLCSWLDMMIGEACGVTKPREGQMAPNSNVTDNVQSIQQSVTITELYFFLHDDFWKEVLSTYVDTFISWAKEQLESNPNQTQMALQYFLSDGQIQMLMISDDMLDDADMGLFVDYSGTAEEYRNKMEQLLLPLLQNEMEGAELISAILKSNHEGTSPEEVHKMIKVMSETYFNRKQEAQQAQAEQAKEIEQMRSDLVIKLHEQEVEKIRIKELENRETLLLLEQARQQGVQDGLIVDSMNNEMQMSVDQENRAKENELRERELGLKQEEINVKREDVKVKAIQKASPKS